MKKALIEYNEGVCTVRCPNCESAGKSWRTPEEALELFATLDRGSTYIRWAEQIPTWGADSRLVLAMVILLFWILSAFAEMAILEKKGKL